MKIGANWGGVQTVPEKGDPDAAGKRDGGMGTRRNDGGKRREDVLNGLSDAKVSDAYMSSPNKKEGNKDPLTALQTRDEASWHSLKKMNFLGGIGGNGMFGAFDDLQGEMPMVEKGHELGNPLARPNSGKANDADSGCSKGLKEPSSPNAEGSYKSARYHHARVGDGTGFAKTGSESAKVRTHCANPQGKVKANPLDGGMSQVVESASGSMIGTSVVKGMKNVPLFVAAELHNVVAVEHPSIAAITGRGLRLWRMKGDESLAKKKKVPNGAEVKRNEKVKEESDKEKSIRWTNRWRKKNVKKKLEFDVNINIANEKKKLMGELATMRVNNLFERRFFGPRRTVECKIPQNRKTAEVPSSGLSGSGGIGGREMGKFRVNPQTSLEEYRKPGDEPVHEFEARPQRMDNAMGQAGLGQGLGDMKEPMAVDGWGSVNATNGMDGEFGKFQTQNREGMMASMHIQSSIMGEAQSGGRKEAKDMRNDGSAGLDAMVGDRKAYGGDMVGRKGQDFESANWEMGSHLTIGQEEHVKDSDADIESYLKCNFDEGDDEPFEGREETGSYIRWGQPREESSFDLESDTWDKSSLDEETRKVWEEAAILLKAKRRSRDAAKASNPRSGANKSQTSWGGASSRSTPMEAKLVGESSWRGDVDESGAGDCSMDVPQPVRRRMDGKEAVGDGGSAWQLDGASHEDGREHWNSSDKGKDKRPEINLAAPGANRDARNDAIKKLRRRERQRKERARHFRIRYGFATEDDLIDWNDDGDVNEPRGTSQRDESAEDCGVLGSHGKQIANKPHGGKNKYLGYGVDGAVLPSSGESKTMKASNAFPHAKDKAEMVEIDCAATSSPHGMANDAMSRQGNAKGACKETRPSAMEAHGLQQARNTGDAKEEMKMNEENKRPSHSFESRKMADTEKRVDTEATKMANGSPHAKSRKGSAEGDGAKAAGIEIPGIDKMVAGGESTVCVECDSDLIDDLDRLINEKEESLLLLELNHGIVRERMENDRRMAGLLRNPSPELMERERALVLREKSRFDVEGILDILKRRFGYNACPFLETLLERRALYESGAHPIWDEMIPNTGLTMREVFGMDRISFLAEVIWNDFFDVEFFSRIDKRYGESKGMRGVDSYEYLHQCESAVRKLVLECTRVLYVKMNNILDEWEKNGVAFHDGAGQSSPLGEDGWE